MHVSARTCHKTSATGSGDLPTNSDREERKRHGPGMHRNAARILRGGAVQTKRSSSGYPMGEFAEGRSARVATRKNAAARWPGVCAAPGGSAARSVTPPRRPPRTRTPHAKHRRAAPPPPC
ncbi:unnamed protein product, partial [Iphiclides podalirius]